jgi:hypothetical protein
MMDDRLLLHFRVTAPTASTGMTSSCWTGGKVHTGTTPRGAATSMVCPAPSAPSSAIRTVPRWPQRVGRSSSGWPSTSMGRAHPVALELAKRLSELATSGFGRVVFTSGGSESVEAAWKIVRQYHLANASRSGARLWRARPRTTRHPRRSVLQRSREVQRAVRSAGCPDTQRLQRERIPVGRQGGSRRGCAAEEVTTGARPPSNRCDGAGLA